MAKKKKERSSAPKLGASYQATKLGFQLGLSPARGALYGADRVEDVRQRLSNPNYWKGAAVALLDQWGSKKIGHAGAISRRSLTAIAPEAIVGLQAAEAQDLDPLNTADDFVQRTDGYSSGDQSFDASRIRTYALLKYGLGVGRKVVNTTRIAEPIKMFLSKLGATL